MRPVVSFVENGVESGGLGLLSRDGIRWPDNSARPAGQGTGRLLYSGKELGRVMKGTRRTIWFMIPGYGAGGELYMYSGKTRNNHSTSTK